MKAVVHVLKKLRNIRSDLIRNGKLKTKPAAKHAVSYYSLQFAVLVLYIICRSRSTTASRILSTDQRNDCFTNMVALAGAYCGQHFWKYADPLGAAVVRSATFSVPSRHHVRVGSTLECGRFRLPNRRLRAT